MRAGRGAIGLPLELCVACTGGTVEFDLGAGGGGTRVVAGASSWSMGLLLWNQTVFTGRYRLGYCLGERKGNFRRFLGVVDGAADRQVPGRWPSLCKLNGIAATSRLLLLTVGAIAPEDWLSAVIRIPVETCAERSARKRTPGGAGG